MLYEKMLDLLKFKRAVRQSPPGRGDPSLN